MRKKVDLIQGSPEWLSWRNSGIGASDVAAIEGEFPSKTPLQLWYQKMTGEKTPDNPAMKRGRDREPIVRQRCNMFFCTSYQPTCFENTKYPWLRASLDGWHDDKGALEIKVPNIEAHKMAKQGSVPGYYRWQCQTIMLITEITDMWYTSENDEDYADVSVKRDDSLCEKILKDTKAFWDRMQEFDPPPETDRDYLHFQDRYGFEDDIKHTHMQLKIWEEKYEHLRKKALEEVGARNAYLGGLKITKSLRPGNVDYCKVIEEYERILEELQLGDRKLDVEKFRKNPITSYRFS